MGLSITATDVRQLAPGVWSFEMPPHQVRFFGDCRKADGDRSVLLIANPRFDPETRSLVFDADGASPLNVGNTNSALAVSVISFVSEKPKSVLSERLSFGPGDREFLGLVERLPPKGRSAAAELLNRVRAKYPGDLKRGLQRNFSNTPDNFWYVIVQPRIGGLSVTVRGLPERFGQSKLELKMDRPGYTRFKVTEPAEIDEAMRIISASKKHG